MSFKRIKRYIKNKNLNPMNNRKKVGIILFATSIGLFFLFAARLTYLVVVGQVAGTSLKEKTEALYQGSSVVKARRGTIYDRNGIAIAEDATSYSVKAILSTKYMTGSKKLYAEEKNFDKLAEILHDKLGMEKKYALSQLENGLKDERYQVEFGKNGKGITLAKKEEIEKTLEEQELTGLYFDDHPARIYPNGVFSSHFIGIAESKVDKNGIDKGLEGILGLEASYNDVLSGTDGKVVYQKDNYQNPLAGTVAEEVKAKDGQDIYTTIDSRLQTYMETLMDASNKKYKPENMTAMLMEAKTGEILAMAQRPTFNPETETEFKDGEFEWRNLLVQDRYEPGSTMKVMTTAAALDDGVFNENETFVSGKIKVADATINDHDQGAKGVLTMRQALSWSSNVGMVKLEQKLGTRWQRYLQQFGFGKSTYSGLPDENVGILPTSNVVDQAMSSFGQAIGVTNFQMMQAFSAIANDGKMLKPQYISKIVDPATGKERVTQPEVLGQPVSAESASKVREYMRDVVESENYGSAYGHYEVPGYNISAKTGTAQVVAEDGGYLEGETSYLYSIVEMIPSEEPEYILYMTMKVPETWEQDALASIGNPLLKRAMDFKETEESQPDKENSETITVADYRNLAVDTAANDATKSGLNPIVIGNGEKVKEQSTPSGSELMSSERLLLKTTGDEFTMPDTSGWSKADLLKLGELLDITVNFDGEGYCVEQSVAPYEKINEEVTFTLQNN
ncbi:penicillin-binding transpeptidase domain-containing protein [Enterococcus songbeiensis]|uniref:penicillin-binding transpeptidase domain-containing protein n=1 Tax=Enterococcus songbeiensis TaxID=2559927 RepID=UPI0010F83C45|nr:penicillin-binding transpeptidase domain-containing protein [Enterococcus songbeiensis]